MGLIILLAFDVERSSAQSDSLTIGVWSKSSGIKWSFVVSVANPMPSSFYDSGTMYLDIDTVFRSGNDTINQQFTRTHER
ncbi:MAG TPA: hypothetical protein VGM92_11645 [Candidatus Kapabacteria bacterium]|jgi:hypothetical protein